MAISLIDAHSGTIGNNFIFLVENLLVYLQYLYLKGCLGCKTEIDLPLNSKLAIIAGTSACHMVVSK